MKTNKLLFLCTLAASLLLAACGGGPGDAVNALASIEPFLGVGTPPPACDFQNYVSRPCLFSNDHCQPVENATLVFLQANFKWDNPYSCSLPGWDLRVVRDDPSYPSQLQALYQVLEPSVLHFQMPTKLEPNTRYFWQIGPSQYLGGVVDVSNIYEAYFWTGPLCKLSQLKAPVVYSPLNGAEVNDPFPDPALEAAHPGNCAPTAYEYQLSKEPLFNGPLIYWSAFYNHSTLPNLTSPGATGGGGLADCETYFWRLRALNSEGAGPWTETFSFFTDYDNECPSIFDFFPDLYLEEFLFPEPSPYAVPIENANCRLGDTLQHKNVATLFAGKPYKVTAMNPQATYVRIYEAKSAVECWVWVDLVVLGEDLGVKTPEEIFEMVPISQPPPVATPTFTPEPEGPTATPAPQCSDGIDNDGDGHTDYSPTGAGDPQCRTASDNDEANP